MSLNVYKVRANTHDPFSRHSRSPIYADHMARWRPESRLGALFRGVGRLFRRRSAASEASRSSPCALRNEDRGSLAAIPAQPEGQLSRSPSARIPA